jgi:hypothetical protein
LPLHSDTKKPARVLPPAPAKFESSERHPGFPDDVYFS